VVQATVDLLGGIQESKLLFKASRGFTVLPLAHVVLCLAHVIVKPRGWATGGGGVRGGNGGLLALHNTII
jgi:hypothetical protein